MADFSDALNQLHGLMTKRVQAIIQIDGVTVAIALGTLTRTYDHPQGMRSFGSDPETLHLAIMSGDLNNATSIAIAPSKVKRVVLDPSGVEFRFDGWSVDIFEWSMPTTMQDPAS